MTIENLKTYYIYINKENSIMQVKENLIPCKPLEDSISLISKMALIQHIQKMKKDALGSYILSSMALHHVVVNDNHVSDYVDNKITHHSFFREISYLSDVQLAKTDPIFYPLTTLYIIFQEKPPHTPCQSQTKKVRFDLGKTKKRKSLKQKY